MTFAGRLQNTLKDAGHAVVSVSIGDSAVRSTWTVQPSSLQGACQSLIDAFDPNDPAQSVKSVRDLPKERYAEVMAKLK